MSEVTLRPMGPADEAEARAAHAELGADGFDFLLDAFDPAEPWSDYLARVERSAVGVDLPADRVPATFLLAEIDGTVVGRVSIRHELNDYLTEWGGHVGYGVRPAFRHRGYATAILRQSLTVARSLGISRALVTCDDRNAASAHVIERCGGVLDNVQPGPEPGQVTRRYWITT